MSRSTTRHATTQHYHHPLFLVNVCLAVYTAVCRRSKNNNFYSSSHLLPSPTSKATLLDFSTIDRYAGASTSTTPHHTTPARPFTPPSDLTSPHLPVAVHRRRPHSPPPPTHALVASRAVAIAIAFRKPAFGPTSIRFRPASASASASIHLPCSELLRSHHHSLNLNRPKPPTRPNT